MTPIVIAESAKWIVVAKPPGGRSVPGRVGGRGPVGVLSEWVKANFAGALVVHRLDVETSGVVLFARTEDAHRLASGWFQSHLMKKEYVLLAEGEAKQPVFKVDKPVDGARSVTQIEVIEQYNSAFLGCATPLTGRRHQIRIHLASKGHPILGDIRYGGRDELVTVAHVSRVALHAAKLTLPTGERFEARWPDDFALWVSVLRKNHSCKDVNDG